MQYNSYEQRAGVPPGRGLSLTPAVKVLLIVNIAIL